MLHNVSKSTVSALDFSARSRSNAQPQHLRVGAVSTSRGRCHSVIVRAEIPSPFPKKNARLVLEDGSVWRGVGFGAVGTEIGEVGTDGEGGERTQGAFANPIR